MTVNESSPSYECTEPSHRRLLDELQRHRLGPTPDDLALWIGEILTEDRDDDAGDLIHITEAATMIAAWLQPIGSFSGGGSICVLTDPNGWPYPELAISAYRRRMNAAAERCRYQDYDGRR